MNYSFEALGNSSYLIITFENGEKVINYQLQMLINNKIKNVVAANKQQKNDDICVYYNITSKITLAQAMEKGKLPKAGVIKIIEGAISALKDIEEYQLVSSGLLFDADRIYVKPGEYEPEFIYVPNRTEDGGIEPLKNMLLKLVISSSVEVTNDSFIQVLLETLNNPALSVSQLTELCNRFKGSGDTVKISNEPKVNPIRNQNDEPEIQRPVQSPEKRNEVRSENSLGKTKNVPNPANTPHKKIEKKAEIPGGAVKHEKKIEKKDIEAKNNKKTSGNKVFLLLQIIPIAIFAALILSGAVSDDAGNINFQYLGAAALVLGCADFIIYREKFAKKEAVKASENAAAVKKSSKPSAKKQIPVTKKSSVNVPGKAAVAAKKTKPAAKSELISDFENENTVVMTDNSDGAYLEYFENGISKKIWLDKEIVVVGKLRTRCDYAINNNKISKLHAEFITRDGQYFVKDYNSTNGTYINGGNRRIEGNAEYQIFNGDRITLADVDMAFFC